VSMPEPVSVTNVLLKNWCGPVFHLPARNRSRLCISDMINLHSSGVAGCKDIPAKQFFIFSQTTLLQNCRALVTVARADFMLCNVQARVGFKCRRDPIRDSTLNPYKQAIFLQLRVIKNSLVHYEIGAK
jgi:hypothetical protein